MKARDFRIPFNHNMLRKILKKNSSISTKEIIFLLGVYAGGLLLRLLPKLMAHPHLLTFEADVWYRLCLAQYFLDWGHLPAWDIRYASYGQVPFWYNPLGVYFLAALGKLTSLDLPTVCSRVMPFVESLVVLPFYWLCRRLYGIRVAVISTVFLGLTPSFVYWTGICTPQTFTLFMLPLILLLWINFVQQRFILKNKWLHVVLMGALLGVNFFVHLTYFNIVIIVLLVHLALMRRGAAKAGHLPYFALAVLLSQVITSWWWLPKNLYWWWTQAISTSTAFFDPGQFLKHYGPISAILGHIAFIFVGWMALRNNKNSFLYYVPLYWTVFLLVESHMEWLLLLIHKQNLVWHTFIRPIEGFRFYSFLAQPLAMCFGIMLDKIFHAKRLERLTPWVRKNLLRWGLVGLIVLLSINMVAPYGIIERFHKFRVTPEDIRAAYWLRDNLKKDEKVLSNYYAAQMFAGVMGGRALLGAMFPLKKKVLPYIGDGYRVLFDIYSVYTSEDILEIKEIMRRYGCTHVHLSDYTLSRLEYAVNGFGDTRGLARGDFDGLVGKDYSATLMNPKYFRVVYHKDGVKVLKLKED